MRAPNLKPKDVQWIVQLIAAWTGPLTWPTLIEAVRRHRDVTYTRSALSAHSSIQRAYSLRKKAGTEPELPRQTYVQQIRSSLAAERARRQGLERELNAITERILTIMVNASQHGLTEQQLLRPLPKIDRASRRRRAGAPPPPKPVQSRRDGLGGSEQQPSPLNAGVGKLKDRLRVVPPPTES